jgi:XTP/dITP diphosphohydrolase
MQGRRPEGRLLSAVVAEKNWNFPGAGAISRAMSGPPKRLVIATHNTHKTDEFRALLGEAWHVEDLTQHPALPVPVEDGDSFEANAGIKARSAGACLGPEVLVVADDSGLEADALGGRPGIFSARYAGAGAGDVANRDKVLAEMAEVPRHLRTARFRCVLAVARGSEVIAAFSGAVEGRLAETATGRGGFGYDPIFIPDGHDASFGELPAEIKNGLSHRARALGRLLRWLEDAELTAPP